MCTHQMTLAHIALEVNQGGWDSSSPLVLELRGITLGTPAAIRSLPAHGLLSAGQALCLGYNILENLPGPWMPKYLSGAALLVLST